MKNFRIYALMTGSVLLTSGALLMACGDDDDLPPDTIDAGGDGSRPDGSRPDATPEDTGAPDAAPDVRDGGRTDAAVDAGYDSGIHDAGTFDGGGPSYATTLAERLCSSLAKCCYGNALPDGGAVDGGTFDRVDCLRVYSDLGFERSNEAYTGVDAGSVTVDSAKAALCLAKVDAIACSLDGNALADIRKTCFEALVGKLKAGDTCEASVECADGLFCNPGTAKCEALKKQGEPCAVYTTAQMASDDRAAYESEIACSWRAGANTGMHCASYDYTNNRYFARAQWTCQPNVALGSGCNDSSWCQVGGVCDPTAGFVCKTPVTYFNSNVCNGFRDAP